MKTIFTEITEEMYHKLVQYGFFYDSRSYINVYRWMWQEKHIHPDMKSFPTSADDKTIITFNNLKTQKTQSVYATGFDDAIIKAVEFICENIQNFC